MYRIIYIPDEILRARCICLIIVHIKMYKIFANTLKNINQRKGEIPDCLS